MGQEKSFAASSNLNGKENKNPQEVKWRKSINPLHYVKPIQYETEEPKSSSELNSSEETFHINLKNNGLVEYEDFDSIRENLEEEKNNKNQFESEFIPKKVEVKWGKFITMKKKNFLNDYKILNEIGRGGFGCVYRVSMRNNCNVLRAAKRINKLKLQSEEHKSLLEEMSVMMNLDHPNITKLFEVYDQQNHYVMIMELCEGGELFDKIANRKIEEKDAQMIVRQVVSALNYMHCQGIVHRDIKPENIIFEEKTKLIKIIDFGISAKIEKGKMLTERVGSPCFIAPDVLGKSYNEKCDMWSLGVVLFMMIYSIPPFKGNSPNKMMECIISDEIIFKNPAHFKFSSLSLDFLKKLLNRNPNNRLSARDALSHKWLKKAGCYKISEGECLKNKLKVLNRIAKFHLLSSEERSEMIEVFQSLDENHNGVIEMSELKEALRENSIDLDDNKIKAIRDYLDTNCSGQIDLTEFLVAAIDPKTMIQQKHLDQAFAYFDIDNSGEITFEEVKEFLEDEETTLAEIKQLFRSLDNNGDGVLTKDEFVHHLAPITKV